MSNRISSIAALAFAAFLFAPQGAHAVFLSPSGLGQALVYPYYIANDRNSTLFTLSNTTASGKAVKVRFLEGYNGRDVLDLNVYLSPFDVWVAQVFQGGPGAAIATFDSSCTVPKVPSTADDAMLFSTTSFDGSSPQGKDGGPTDLSRTLEGHIEVVEMGTVTGTTLTAITHVEGVPANCPSIVGAWQAGSGYWSQNPQTDIGPPSGGLYGSAAIVDVALGTIEAYVAEALGQFYTAGGTGQHTAPNELVPNLSSGTSRSSLAFPNDSPFVANFDRSIDAVSSVFMADAIFNDYLTSTGIAADSEWVVTYPTKRFYVDAYYVDATAAPPFDSVFGPAFSCSEVDDYYHDREEASTSGGTGVGGAPPPPYSTLCTETQTLTFRQGSDFPPTKPSKVLGSNLIASNLASPFENGWADVDLAHNFVGAPAPSHKLSTSAGSSFLGQPVVGFLVSQFVNGNVGGALANYTALYRHKVHVTCRTNAAQPCS
jgi:hypothetical protein